MSPDLINEIKSKGYWRVVIRPSESYYKSDRIALEKLSEIVDNNQIQLRGWYYPHIDQGDVSVSSQNSIASGCTGFEGIFEYWEFFTSGQFAHLFSIKEDYIIDEPKKEQILKSIFYNRTPPADLDKFFEVVSAIYRFTEIHLFAANLVQLEQYKDVGEFEISITIHGVNNRLLFFWDWGRDLSMPYVCKLKDDQISFNAKYRKEDLIAKCNDIALEKAITTFKMFNWSNPSPQVIRGDQERLLQRRF